MKRQKPIARKESEPVKHVFTVERRRLVYISSTKN